MACSHASTCPLHPYLNHSLGAWRDHYCDSADGWRTCARYQRSLSGESMPLALLPNGKMVAGIAEATANPSGEPVTAPSAATGTATSPGDSASSTATALLTDEQAQAVLAEAQTAKPSRWRRFTNLFRLR